MFSRSCKSFVVIVLVSFLLSGCAAYSVSPVTGFIYNDVKAPLAATEFDDDSKVGRATATSILGLVAYGDASIQAAMDDAGITKIHHVDFRSKSVLGIYAEFTTIVYGR